MKIYFAGAIRAGRADSEIYLEMIKILGQKHTVLTEHVGDNKTASAGASDYIYKRDVSWIRECDLVVAEVSTPSLGVGYEIAFAEHLKKPIICLYRPQPDKRLSAMIGGNAYLKIHNYENIDDAREILTRI